MSKVISEFIDAFDLSLGERAPGKTVESFDWRDIRHRYLFASDYPALYRAVKRELQKRTKEDLNA